MVAVIANRPRTPAVCEIRIAVNILFRGV
jgi:hypothetical protein